jgi:hypothetical protein
MGTAIKGWILLFCSLLLNPSLIAVEGIEADPYTVRTNQIDILKGSKRNP